MKKRENGSVPLFRAKKGAFVRIIEIPEGKSKAQLIRLGILQGHVVKCLEKLPGGTVVIQKNRQELALGMALAKSILVAYIHTFTE